MCQHDGEDPYKKEDMHCNFEEQVAELFVKDGQMSRCQTVKWVDLTTKAAHEIHGRRGVPDTKGKIFAAAKYNEVTDVTDDDY